MSQSAIPYSVVCYINGVKVRPMSVAVTATRGEFASFSVDVPGIPEWAILPPRSHCAVFYIDPVTLDWRFLCEGEFESVVRSKDQAGGRSRTLMFRSLQGIFSTATYTSLGVLPGMTPADSLKMVANGRELAPSGAKLADIPDLNGLIEVFTKREGRTANLFQLLAKHVMLQMPVEAFYFYARKIEQKMYTLPDIDVDGVIDVERFRQLASGGINDRSLHANISLLELILRYEAMAMYQHIPVLSPPILSPDSQTPVIPELLFTPAMHGVIPPACNVIFQDQITQLSAQENFGMEPTRVVVQSLLRVGDDSTTVATPQVFMCNKMDSTYDVGTQVSQYPGTRSSVAATHGMLSKDEMLRGVISRYIPFDLIAKVASKVVRESLSKQKDAGLNAFLSQCARTNFELERMQYRTAQVSCVFLPNLIPGLQCIVEDMTGPFSGMIHSVTHILPCTGSPQTSVTINYTKELYVVDGENHTPPLPAWLNSSYRPAKVAKTWASLFGTSLHSEDGEFLSAMVPASVITKQLGGGLLTAATAIASVITGAAAYDASDQINLEQLAALVIPVPTYNKKGELVSGTSDSPNCYAEKMRGQADVPQAMQQYNWRPGISISQYAKFHGIDIGTINDSGLVDPPAHLFKDAVVDGNALYGSPFGMTLTGPTTNDAKYGYVNEVNSATGQYGIYKLTNSGGSVIDRKRQTAMMTIETALQRRITKS